MAKKKKAAAKKPRKASKAAGRRHATRATTATVSNGLRTFAMHQCESDDAPMLAAVRTEPSIHPAAAAGGAAFRKRLDPETAAERYLQSALESKAVPAITAPKVENAESEFKSLGTETIPLTATKVVKFRQTLNKIPIYGSLVSVELDDSNDLVSISSAIGDPKGVDPVAKISPADALKAVKNYPEYKSQLDEVVPRLNYYFDRSGQKWRLVYILEDVPVRPTERKPNPSGKGADAADLAPFYMDFVVDAHDGKVVAELPRTPNVAVVESGKDELGVLRHFGVEMNGATKILKNTKLNVQTFDFAFRDPEIQRNKLPGTAISNPPSFSATAISAHANAEAVAVFLQNELKRNNIDDHGGAMNSAINCVVAAERLGPREWANAFWDGAEMVYGQVKQNGVLISFCRDLDVVAHEMFHGVTDSTSRLEYALESGALNESYSDIFGVIVANFAEPDIRNWSWEIGKGLDSGNPLRDMSDPPRFGQPDKMQDFFHSPNTRRGDNGGVHTNSGIPNKAAFNILTAVDANGDLIFAPREVAIVFYLALTQRLSRTSQFSDSRQAVVLSAQTLFRNLSAAKLKEKIDTIKKAFDDVGIT